MAKKKKTLKVDEDLLERKFGSDITSKKLTAKMVSDNFTVAELKNILRKNGLKVSGKKQILVERVLPILKDELSKKSDEDTSDTSESKQKAKNIEDEKEVSKQSEDSDSIDNVDLPLDANEELIKSTIGIFGMNYDDLATNDKISVDDNGNLNIKGFTQNGLIMSDSTMSIVADSDSSNMDMNMKIPEVTFTNFEDTIFTFKNLDLFILPSSKPESLEFSVLMDSLEIITENNYVNLRGLDLFLKSFPENEGIRLDIGINSFIYPNFGDTSIKFDDIDLKLAIGLDGQNLDISVNLPKLDLINKDYRVNLYDLNLNVALPDLQLSNLDLSIDIPKFQYTNFDDTHIEMDNVKVSHEPISNLNAFKVFIAMDAFDATGLNSFDELFPMLNISEVHFNNPTTSSEAPIKLTSIMSIFDVSKIDLTTMITLLISGFNLDTYLSNMSELYKDSFDADAISSAGVSFSGLNLPGIIENIDYSTLNTIKLDLSRLIDSSGIDLSNFGIDFSDYDLSSISVSELIDVLSSSYLINSAITAIPKLLTLDTNNLDMSSMVRFDPKKFDLSPLLASLNLSELDISAIMSILNNPDLDLAGVFKNCDYSCLDAIVLDLSRLIDSLDIELSDLGIDLSDYDLSAISLSEIIGIINKLELDMSTIITMLKLSGLELGDLDLDGLIASFDAENFDLSVLLASLNLSELNIPAIIEIFNNPDLNLDAVFKDCDYSCLDAIVLDLSRLVDSLGIDLSDLGIDLSDYDLSAISLSDLIDIISKLNWDMSTVTALLKLSGLELGDLDLDALIASFDAENFDLSTLLASLNLSELDIPAIMEMFNKYGVELDTVFKNCDYSSLNSIKLDLTGLMDSLDLDLSKLDIDLSDYDLSAIGVADLIDIISKLDIDMSTIDLSAIDFKGLDLSGLIASFDAENFDLSTLLASLNLSNLDIPAIIEIFNNPDLKLDVVFKDCDYSCLDAIVLDLSRLVDSLGIDLSDLGIDLSDYDLSAISLSDLIDIISKLNWDMSTVTALLKLSGLELGDLDLDALIASFDAENFDMSTLLASLNLSELNISAIVDIFNNPDLKLVRVFKDCDYSCLDAIVLDLSRLVDSLDIELSELGIDLSDYDLSAISLSDLIDIISKIKWDMSTTTLMLKLSGLELGDLDLDTLIASFDAENFDMSALLASLNLSGLDISAIMEIFNNPDVDLAELFKDCDYSCLDAVVLDLSGLIDSLDIDLLEFGIDLSNYNLSAISLAELIDVLSKSIFINTVIDAFLKVSAIDTDALDTSDLIVSFDAENFDLSTMYNSLNLPVLDNAGILLMLEKNGIVLSEFLNNMVCMFMQKTLPGAA